ncbi:hypothetical protein L596_016275 [Steinernema carpocapsae]|uniref:Uncharacterized protein n=1 Tax=Steinernema carpocapsae TaxID=34508 RepID=A0A4V6A3E4_STECR|nr:hypothetical protein L596_016275 [Steinernema carpocapsae]
MASAQFSALPSSEKYGTPFDPVFGLPCLTPKVAPTTFKTYSEGMQKDDWITMAVIVERSETKKSANGKEYMIWNLSDLYDCQQKATKAILFASCVQDHWKMQVGTLIALTNADCDLDQKTGEVTIKLFKSNQVMEIGQCPMFGICAASKKDGERCKSFVNLSVSDHCAYHIQTTANRLASRRGTFNTGAVSMPKLFAGKPMGDFSNYFYAGRMVQTKSAPVKSERLGKVDPNQPKGLYVSEPQIRDNEKKVLNQFISSGNLHHRGARNLMIKKNNLPARAADMPAPKPRSALAGLGSPPETAKPSCLQNFKLLSAREHFGIGRVRHLVRDVVSRMSSKAEILTEILRSF